MLHLKKWFLVGLFVFSSGLVGAAQAQLELDPENPSGFTDAGQPYYEVDGFAPLALVLDFKEHVCFQRARIQHASGQISDADAYTGAGQHITDQILVHFDDDFDFKDNISNCSVFYNIVFDVVRVAENNLSVVRLNGTLEAHIILSVAGEFVTLPLYSASLYKTLLFVSGNEEDERDVVLNSVISMGGSLGRDFRWSFQQEEAEAP
ncbi:hypothetical protein [Deinococcus roseus]|uniref:Uncharacterized protein n=1 Tax=Deinococcus roseus TaxID=392414 RepID=A0ABQ2D7M4_9DEIO|nr:hypothetical protein [Deinococcus roseus]GGJ44667.1 hypothetical protein GCM10008938_33550 [Deinococcus roseus]